MLYKNSTHYCFIDKCHHFVILNTLSFKEEFGLKIETKADKCYKQVFI